MMYSTSSAGGAFKRLTLFCYNNEKLTPNNLSEISLALNQVEQLLPSIKSEVKNMLSNGAKL